jgi:hypothetical protein
MKFVSNLLSDNDSYLGLSTRSRGCDNGLEIGRFSSRPPKNVSRHGRNYHLSLVYQLLEEMITSWFYYSDNEVAQILTIFDL